MLISETIAKLQQLKDLHGDLQCVAEYCENLWRLTPENICFMKQREVNLDIIEDVIVIG